MEEYVDIIAECLRYIPKSIVIHRLTGDGPKSILVALCGAVTRKLFLIIWTSASMNLMLSREVFVLKVDYSVLFPE